MMPAYTPTKGKANCGNCLYSRPSGMEHDDVLCCRFPPQITAREHYKGYFPALSSLDICGEWQVYSEGRIVANEVHPKPEQKK